MDKKIEKVSCILCESNNYINIHDKGHFDISLNLVLCKKCGLGYLNPRWTKEEYLKYYQEEYDKQYRSELNILDKTTLQKKNIIYERFKNKGFLNESQNSILDIGSGSGENLIYFKEKNPETICYAIEPSIVSQKILVNNDIQVISDDVDTNWQTNFENSFDVVIMRHVLEHFLNPLEVLQKVHHVLKDSGVLYLAVPNNLLENRNEGWLRVAHTYYFNKFTLSSILNKAKFKITSLKTQDEFNSFEVYVFAKKNETDISLIFDKEVYKRQKNVFWKVLNKKNIFFMTKSILKKNYLKIKKNILKVKYFKKNTQKVFPQIISKKKNPSNNKLFHVSAFNYGNAGDVLLPLALQDTWASLDKSINWINQAVYPKVDSVLVDKINKSKGVVIGGGGLFLKDTNANQESGWQWPCSVEMLQKIKVPIVLYAIGYNRFRGQEEFEPYFKDNITAFAEKAVYIGLRNTGSIEAIKKYIPVSLHHKLRFQPCMTTFLSELYTDEFDFDTKQDFIAFNAAFDRSHLRFGENIGKILSDTALVLKDLSAILPIKFYSHMPSDESIIPFLQSYGVKYELVRLHDTHPRKIIEAYAKPKLVIGMRGHAQMIPFGCKTPIISIISHDKMQWFLEDIQKPEWGIDVLSESYKEDLKEKALASLANTNERITYINQKQKELYAISIENVEEGLVAMGLN